MEHNVNAQMAEKVAGFRLPRYRELPDMGLYLEQITKYINGFLSPLGCTELTSSMISNYVKKGVLSAPVKKQYSAEQIAYLFFIGFAKSVLSIENIHQLLNIQKKSYRTDIAYDYFCLEFENMLRFTYGLKDAVETVGVTNTKEKSIFRSIIIAISHIIYINNSLNEVKKI